MSEATVTRIEFPNFSGMLFRKGQARTPFSTLIGAMPLITNHAEFATGVFYNAATGSQPSISEEASLTAPAAKPVSRTQKTNVTQIFQQKVSVSYAKESDMGTLSGVNAAGAKANPASELTFQVSCAMDQIAADIEYSFLRGVYKKAASKDEANQTCGLLNAIETNVIPIAGSDGTGTALTYWVVAKALAAIRAQGGDTNNIVLGVAPAAALQLNKDASNNQYMQDVVTMMGLNVQRVVTPLGVVNVSILDTLAAQGEENTNSAVLFNPAEIHPVFQPVPGKGNFFLEPLAKTGAGNDYQIFGQAGLDFGAEFHAAKITGISNDLPTGTL